MVRDATTFCGAKRARVMIWALLDYMKKIYNLRRDRTLFAIAVTKESDRLMRKLNFELVSEAKHRQDKCNMYKYQLTKASWDALLQRIGDFSRMFTCRF